MEKMAYHDLYLIKVKHFKTVLNTHCNQRQKVDDVDGHLLVMMTMAMVTNRKVYVECLKERQLCYA